MAVKLWAYGDESGIEESARYCLIAGYVGSPRQWTQFRREWAAVLDEYGVPEFHAKEFFPYEKRRHVDHYREWSEHRCTDFLAALLRILSWRRLIPIGTAVEMAGWKALSHDERRFLTGGMISQKTVMKQDGFERTSRKFTSSGAPNRPYLAMFQSFIIEALKNTPSDALVHFVLDEQSDFEPVALQVFADQMKTPGRMKNAQMEAKVGDLAFAHSHTTTGMPLQAADLYAYFWNRALNEAINSELLQMVSDAVSETQHYLNYVREEHLRGMLALMENDFEKRKRFGRLIMFGQEEPVNGVTANDN